MSSTIQDPQVEALGSELDFREPDVDALVEYVLTNHYIGGTRDEIPLDCSLLEAGIIDSFDLIELVGFIESNWQIQIPDPEITKANMGSVLRMAAFIKKKQQQVP